MNKNPKILIAEDDKDLGEMYATLLGTIAITELAIDGKEAINKIVLELAIDGEEAINKIVLGKPDLAVLDIMMPKKTGTEVLREIRNNKSLDDISVIVLTALSDMRTKKEVESLGAVFLVKAETSPGDLVTVIKKELTKRYEKAR